MNRKINWDGANYKDWIGVPAAIIFWVASLICFVFGLSFKTGTGIYFPGTLVDITLLFSFGLGIANTIIQIVGNDTEREDLGMALFLMWGASYMLGVGSNVNFLNGVVGLNNPLLQFLVCWGLGIMIEVAPERLLVKFLRAVGILQNSERKLPSQQPSTVGKRVTDREAHISQLRSQHQSPPKNQNYHTPMKVKERSGKGQPNHPESRYKGEPTYHPMGQPYQEPEGDIPPFMKQIMKDADRAVRG